jgi:hypothetical protein
MVPGAGIAMGESPRRLMMMLLYARHGSRRSG